MQCSLVFPVVGLRFGLMCCCVMHFLIVEAEKCCRFSYVILISHHSRLKSDHCDKVFDALSLHLVLLPTMQQPAFTTDTHPHQCSHQQHSSQVVLMNNPVVDLYFDPSLLAIGPFLLSLHVLRWQNRSIPQLPSSHEVAVNPNSSKITMRITMQQSNEMQAFLQSEHFLFLLNM